MKLRITLKRQVPQTMTAELEVEDAAGAEIIKRINLGKAFTSERLWACQQAPLHGGIWQDVPTPGTPFAGYADIEVKVEEVK